MKIEKPESNYYPIPLIPGYRINYQGYILDQDYEQVERYVSDDRVFVRVNNVGYAVDNLVWTTFIGYTSYPIFHLDDNGLNTNANNLYVETEIEQKSEDIFYVNGILFKRIPLCPNYLIDRFGTVFGLKRGRFLVKAFNEKGYPTVSIPDAAGFRSPRKVHRMVYLTYFGELAENKIIDHIDGNILNSCANNLRQIDQSENVSRIFDYRPNIRPANPIGKVKIDTHFEVTDEEVRTICEDLQKNVYPEDIMAHISKSVSMRTYGAFIKLLTRIRQGRIYQNIAADFNISFRPQYPNPGTNFTLFSPMDLTFIKYQLSIKRTQQSIADLYGCTQTSIFHLKQKFQKSGQSAAKP